MYKNKSRHPFVSNNFPEYKLLSRKSRAVLNTLRAAPVMAASSFIVTAVGMNESLQGGIQHNVAEQIAGNHLTELGIKGMIGSVAVGALAAIGYVEMSANDEDRAQQANASDHIQAH
jgi:hypothetical protein